MQTQIKKNNLTAVERNMDISMNNGVNYAQKFFSNEDIMNAFEKIIEFKNFFRQSRLNNLDDQPAKPALPTGKKSFLVFKHNKYITIPIEKIAFFYVKYESSTIMCFDKQEYFVSQSLEQIQNMITDKQFYRLNRQYLINFNAIKEAEHYFARKLLVNLVVPVEDKLLVPKDKVSNFLQWLENR